MCIESYFVADVEPFNGTNHAIYCSITGSHKGPDIESNQCSECSTNHSTLFGADSATDASSDSSG